MSHKDTLEAVVRALNAQPTKDGRFWHACCPVHDDDNPSLFFWIDGKRGVLRFRCWVDCDEASVRLAVERLTGVDLGAPIGLRICAFEGQRQPPPVESLRALTDFEQLPPARSHPYLSAKGIEPVGDVRMDGDALVVPMFNGRRELANLQRIVERRGGILAGNRRAPSKFEKFFLRGLSPRGLLLPLENDGDTPQHPPRIHITEGYATGASVYSALIKSSPASACVVVAFSADNLLPVALTARRRHPHAEVIVCGDNDVAA